jgi:hypothetical protein
MSENILLNSQVQGAAPLPYVSVDEMRKQHIKHEACVKSIGTLYIIGALLMFVAGVLGPAADPQDAFAIKIVVGAFLIGLGAFQFWVAIEIKRLNSWATIPVGVLSGIGLLAFPLGTVINGYILYLVFSKKGRIVFSPEYKKIISATPHIKYRTSIVVWLLLAVLVLVLAILLMGTALAH